MTTRALPGPGQPRPRLRRARKERGWSGNDVAVKLYNLGIENHVPEHKLGVDARTVSNWELGKREPNETYTALLSLLYELPPSQLDLSPLVLPVPEPKSPPLPSRATYDPDEMRRRQFLAGMLGGGAALMTGSWAVDPEHLSAALSIPTKLDSHLVMSLGDLTRTYISVQDRIAPQVLLPAVVQHVRNLRQLGEQSGNAEVKSLTAQAACLAGWLSFDLENRSDAGAYWVFGADLAAELGASSLYAYALGARTYLHPRPHWLATRRSIAPGTVLDHAIESATNHAKPGLLAWLHSRRAEEHAISGDSLNAMRSLGAARRAMAMPQTEDRLLFLDRWHDGRMLRFEGSTAQLLGDHQTAIAALENSLQNLAPQLLPQRAIVLVQLAIAHAGRHDADQACADLMAALDISQQANLAEVDSRIQRARRYLDPWQNSPAVIDLDARLHDLSMT
jgi:transcriptional regulator with XRE-family HTH domain